MVFRDCIFLLFVLVLLCRGAGASPPQTLSEHADLSYYTAADGSHAAIRTAADWERRHSEIIAGMEQVMGPLPRPREPVALNVQVLEEQSEAGYVRRKISYHTDDTGTTMRAWLLIPRESNEAKSKKQESAKPAPRAAILCLHQTISQGKDSVVGLADRPSLHYAKELALRGYVTLAPDYPSFGELKPYDFQKGEYVSGTMKAIYDNTRAIDLLQSLPEVDGERVGCVGHSLGGHNGLFTAAFDRRLKATVTCCGFTSFHKYKGGDLRGWASPRYMPLIAKNYQSSPDLVPFDFAEVVAAIAPRGVFVVAPLRDSNFAVEGVREAVDSAAAIFRLLDQPDGLKAVYPDSDHDFPAAERKAAYEFLDRYLDSDAN